MRFLSNEHKGALLAISSGLSYGLLGYFGVTIINEGLSVSNMLLWRFVISSILITLIIIVKFKGLEVEPKEIIKGILLGAAFYSTSSVTYFIASKTIGTGLSMVIVFTYPALVMGLNWLLYNAKITRTYYLAIIIIVIGLVLLADVTDFKFDIIGIGFALLSAALYALYVVYSKKNKLPPLMSTFMVSIGCSIACLIFAIIDNSLVIPATFDVWANIIAIGIICTALPIFLLFECFKYISTDKASILSVLEPVFVVIFGLILLDEKITMLQLAGIAIILFGALITLFSNNKQK